MLRNYRNNSGRLNGHICLNFQWKHTHTTINWNANMSITVYKSFSFELSKGIRKRVKSDIFFSFKSWGNIFQTFNFTNLEIFRLLKDIISLVLLFVVNFRKRSTLNVPFWNWFRMNAFVLIKMRQCLSPFKDILRLFCRCFCDVQQNYYSNWADDLVRVFGIVYYMQKCSSCKQTAPFADPCLYLARANVGRKIQINRLWLSTCDGW